VYPPQWLSIEKTPPVLICSTGELSVGEKKNVYSETLNKPESCINRILNKVPMHEILVNLTCINQTPVYFKHKSWSQ
jgi:hypothetical protein